MTDTMIQDSLEAAAQAIVQLDPRTLLVDLNIREARVDRDLVDSITELGVLQAVTVVTTAEGGHRVRYGHRRTLAAIEAGRPLIPAVIAGPEDSAKTAQVARIIEQWHENEVRENLTRAERIEATAQLAAFGISPTQIAKRTNQAKEEVHRALTVAASPAARQAAQDEALTLEDAALLAEFEGDEAAVARILDAAGRTYGASAAHIAQRIRNERADAAREAKFVQSLRAQGVKILDPQAEGYTGRPVRALRNAEGQALSAETHGECPGHAAVIARGHGYVDESTGRPVESDGDEEDQDEEDAGQVGPALVWMSFPLPSWVCSDPATYGHTLATPESDGGKRVGEMSEAEQEQARAARRAVIRCNKEWKAAQPVRRDWLRTFLTRKTAPKDAAAFMAQIVATHADVVSRAEANTLAADLLGLGEQTGWGRSKALPEAITRASDARAQVLLLAQLLAGCERDLSPNAWRHLSPTSSRYLVKIEEWGYRLDDVERLACGIEALSEASDTK